MKPAASIPAKPSASPHLAWLTAVSLLANLALAAWLLRTSPSTAAAVSASATNRSPPLAGLAQPDAALGPNANATNAPPFLWSAIESADYRQYIANLRAVGCPEATIRDLIAADLGALYAPRAGAIRSPRKREYWQKYQRDQPSPDQMKQLQSLAREQGAVFHELLGGRYTQQDRIDTLFLQLHGSEQQLLFLPDDKRAAALEALGEADLDTREIELHSQGRYSSEDEQELFDEKLKLLARVLSPAEVEEFRLRNASQARMLRTELQYFTCTPEEFRQIFDARESGKGKVTTNDLLNRGPATEQIRELFGEERAREFERVTDMEYQQARRSVDALGLPAELADQAWQISREARVAADQIAKDTTRPAAERRQQMQALQDQTDRRLQEVLGEKASLAIRRDLRVVLGVTKSNIKP